WETKTGHNAPLYKNDAETVNNIASAFIKSKFNIHGIPLYGRGWADVKSTAQNGFSQPASDQLPMGTWEKGVFDYDHIKHGLY
ncbi:unnamed protein product, partial [Rotaria sp. Silwood1]